MLRHPAVRKPLKSLIITTIGLLAIFGCVAVLLIAFSIARHPPEPVVNLSQAEQAYVDQVDQIMRDSSGYTGMLQRAMSRSDDCANSPGECRRTALAGLLATAGRIEALTTPPLFAEVGKELDGYALNLRRAVQYNETGVRDGSQNALKMSSDQFEAGAEKLKRATALIDSIKGK